MAGGVRALTGLVIADITAGSANQTPQLFGRSLPMPNTQGVLCSEIALA